VRKGGVSRPFYITVNKQDYPSKRHLSGGKSNPDARKYFLFRFSVCFHPQATSLISPWLRCVSMSQGVENDIPQEV
jgi:hypothetical protein